MSRERLLVARAAEVQLHAAIALLKYAIGNLAALQHGIHPAIDDAKKALKECEKARACTIELIERVHA